MTPIPMVISRVQYARYLPRAACSARQSDARILYSSIALVSGSAVDRLGDRLRLVGATPKDLDDLESYRHTFEPAYQYMVVVAQRIVAEANDKVARQTAQRWSWTGRFPKTSSSVIGKLQRFRTRLSTMQDIAGIRIVVPRRFDQELAFSWLEAQFPDAAKYDRLHEPSHGYRAIHLVVPVRERVVEFQIRTQLQDAWAQLSEKLNDRYPGIKYGLDPDEDHLATLQHAGDLIAQAEALDQQYMLGQTPPGFFGKFEELRHGITKFLSQAAGDEGEA
jgi:GTP pyrophosphokinase